MWKKVATQNRIQNLKKKNLSSMDWSHNLALWQKQRRSINTARRGRLSILPRFTLNMTKSTNRPTGRLTDRPADWLTDRSIDRPTDRATDRPIDRPTNRHTNRPTDKPIDRYTDRPTEFQETIYWKQAPINQKTDEHISGPIDRPQDQRIDPLWEMRCSSYKRK